MPVGDKVRCHGNTYRIARQMGRFQMLQCVLRWIVGAMPNRSQMEGSV